MAEIINLSDYHRIYTWVGHDKITDEYFVIYENEGEGEYKIDGPYSTAEEATAAMDAWAAKSNAIRHDGGYTMQ